MKKIIMFTMAGCPYCRAARGWMDELYREHPEYADIPIEIIDETVYPAIAEKYDYYYVPTYYVDGKKLHEGAATKGMIASVFAAALQEG